MTRGVMSVASAQGMSNGDADSTIRSFCVSHIGRSNRSTPASSPAAICSHAVSRVAFLKLPFAACAHFGAPKTAILKHDLFPGACHESFVFVAKRPA